MTTTTESGSRLLDRVRKLLAKAEDESVTPPEAEALTAKAALLMAKYGIDRALLAEERPDSDQPANRFFEVDPPWAAVLVNLLCGLATALRCKAVIPAGSSSQARKRVHIFGYQSDITRLEIIFPSVVMQMGGALAAWPIPARRVAAERRSFLLGYVSAVVSRVKDAEKGALADSVRAGTGAALVLRTREQMVAADLKRAYPLTRKSRVTYSGSGFSDGHAAGMRADLGGSSSVNGGRKAVGR